VACRCVSPMKRDGHGITVGCGYPPFDKYAHWQHSGRPWRLHAGDLEKPFTRHVTRCCRSGGSRDWPDCPGQMMSCRLRGRGFRPSYNGAQGDMGSFSSRPVGALLQKQVELSAPECAGRRDQVAIAEGDAAWLVPRDQEGAIQVDERRVTRD